jgi:hypothetical protein
MKAKLAMLLVLVCGCAVASGEPVDIGSTCDPAAASTAQEIDECADGTATCDPAAVCRDMEIGYNCECATGYFGTGDWCRDVDECVMEIDECPEGSVCHNLSGSYECFPSACPTGCGINTRCVEGEGCVCLDGFELVGGSCVDADGGGA